MTAYFIRRLLLIIPTFIGVTMIAYCIMRHVPGGPVDRIMMQMQMASAQSGVSVGSEAGELPEEAIAELKKGFDLDKSWYHAYALWLGRIFTRFDLGNSYSYQEPVADIIIARFPVSIYFGLTGFVLAYLVSVPLGIIKAVRHGSYFDFFSSAAVFIGYSIPGWAMGALLLVLLAGGEFVAWFPLGEFRSGSYDELPSVVQEMTDPLDVEDDFGQFEWAKLTFPAKAIDQIYHTILPVFCYMLGSFAALTILMKNSIMENIGQDYVRTAFAKGLSPRRVIFLHTLRNSLIPLATGLGHAVGVIMAGSYLIEKVFNIDGIGYLGFTSILSRDYMIVMGILSINIVLTLIGNILSDVLYALVDPRIRFQ
ncbi:MAG: peptide ABC transporter permease [Planctomycetaceae bacterium]|nr:peptide ABC transporter permease [Planctomycetaceae bacterium]